VEMSALSPNRFWPLDNLKANREDAVNTVNNSVNISTTSTRKNVIRQQNGINKIPTTINWRVKDSDLQNPCKTKFKLLRAKRNKSVNCDHKVHIIGDSHLKRSTIKINQYRNTNFVVSSFIKPGADNKKRVHLKKWSLSV
jgi:hypothetical protein